MSQSISRKAKIALYSFDSLGDGLIYLMMAENLRQNSFDITCFGNYAYQISAWLPQLKILPYPKSAVAEALQDFDLVIMSPPQTMRNSMTADVLREMREKWLLICQNTPDTWRFDHTERLKNTLPPAVFDQLKGLANASGSIRYKKFGDESVVMMVLAYLQEKMHLSQVTKTMNLTPPSHLQYRRYAKRIVVSPDSSTPEKKDWYPASFIQLCHALKAKEFEPVIVVAPKNYVYWQGLVNGAVEVPQFHNIGDLAAYIYESGALIASDSGNGHLASFLNIPVVTIYRKRNKRFHWRPDWRPSTVVTPLCTLQWRGKAVWRPFITVDAVMRGLRKALKTVENT